MTSTSMGLSPHRGTIFQSQLAIYLPSTPQNKQPADKENKKTERFRPRLKSSFDELADRTGDSE